MARVIKMSPEVVAMFERLKSQFRDKFGRDPGPSDPVFFDPDSDIPTPMTRNKMIERLKELKNAQNS